MKSLRYRIEAQGLAKKFSGIVLFKEIDFKVSTGDTFSITGPNGSGKSTLLKIVAGLLKPSNGAVTYTEEVHGKLDRDWLPYIGYAGPLINPYEELTAQENIEFALKKNKQHPHTDFLMGYFNLGQHRDKRVKHYSSGMKQRLRLILADLNDPPILLLDEPGTNLDVGGKELLSSYLKRIRENKIIILATNDSDEEKLSGGGIRLG
jgi:ABC-type multidrug transport system ATPase subunit